MAAVLRADPNWGTLPGDVPPSIVTLLKRCLEKDRMRRIADVAVAQFILAEHAGLGAAAAGAVAVRTGRSRTLLWPVVAAVAATAGLSAGLAWWLIPVPAPVVPIRFSIKLGDEDQFSGRQRQSVTISPDGQQVVYVANSRLYRRPIADEDAEAIPGTEGDGTGHWAR